MLKKLLIAAVFLSVLGQAAHADETVANLYNAADAIRQKLELSNHAWTVDMHAHQGNIVETGVSNEAMISETMVVQYNNAIQTVLNTSYLTAKNVFEEKHNEAVDNMHMAIDDLMGATTKLSTVSVVAELAVNADTTQEQMQVQQALEQTDMTITEADVNNYNTALNDVEKFAQQAGAFLSAAQDESITSAVDNYSAQNNIAVASYSAIEYTQDIDKFVISYDNDLYMSFSGFFQNKMVSADDIYNNTMYVQ